MENTPDHKTLDTDQDRGSLTDQLTQLKHEVSTINQKFSQSSVMLQQKYDENRELKEKLIALEIAVQNLYDSSQSQHLGCCSSSCLII